MTAISIPLSDWDRAEIFEHDAEATGKANDALRALRGGQITRARFIRLVSNYQGQALARFARRCSQVAQHHLNAGWPAINAQTVPDSK